jgi:hypothetical protein
MSRLVSPNDLMAAAREAMIEGREPEAKWEWVLIFNFLAANIHAELAESCCLLFKRLYNCPLEDDVIKKIVKYQLERANEINN